jgi:hypothetical protein
MWRNQWKNAKAATTATVETVAVEATAAAETAGNLDS